MQWGRNLLKWWLQCFRKDCNRWHHWKRWILCLTRVLSCGRNERARRSIRKHCIHPRCSKTCLTHILFQFLKLFRSVKIHNNEWWIRPLSFAPRFRCCWRCKRLIRFQLDCNLKVQQRCFRKQSFWFYSTISNVQRTDLMHWIDILRNCSFHNERWSRCC